jgi:hypothetical protein
MKTFRVDGISGLKTAIRLIPDRLKNHFPENPGKNGWFCSKKTVSVFFPVDTFNRAGFNGLLDAVFRAAFGQNHFRFFFGFVKCEDFGAKFHAALAANAFFRVDNYLFSHGASPFSKITG